MKSWEALTPLSTAGVSLEIVSVATASFRHLTLHAGKRDFQCFCSVSDTLPRAYWVLTARVFWIVLAGAQAKKGRRRLQSWGELWTSILFT
jgi:hypothetical protein